jgi:hypothetical protein
VQRGCSCEGRHYFIRPMSKNSAGSMF